MRVLGITYTVSDLLAESASAGEFAFYPLIGALQVWESACLD